MARRGTPLDKQAALYLLSRASISLDDFGAPDGKKKRKLGSAKQKLKRADDELTGFLDALKKGQHHHLDRMGVKHLIALYARAHESVYGVPPLELEEGDKYAGATNAANRMLKKEFDDDVLKMAEFVRWVWSEERKKEKWRRSNGRETRRIGWRLQFVARNLVTDYRVHLARMNGRTK